MSLSKLIQALQILLKYGDPACPTHCEHDELYVCGIHPSEVTSDDIAELDRLGFFISSDGACFISYLYGSA